MGGEVPTLIENLSQQQIKLAKIIEGAGQNLIALENQLATASGSLETALANRTQQLQAVLDDYTVALDATLASRAEALDVQLVQRTRALDAAFSERLALVDDSMQRSAMAIDAAFSQKAGALTAAVENHVRVVVRHAGAAGAEHGRVAPALDAGHRHRGERQGARPVGRHREPRARAVGHPGAPGQQLRCLDAARHRCGAPHLRQHHAPVAQGHRRSVRPGRSA